MVNIVSLSGGKDSTAMLLMMLEKKIQIDRIIFVDTTKEFPGMYKHIEKLQKYIKPLKIGIVKFDYDYWLSERIKTRGNNRNHKGMAWPDFQNRWCTQIKMYTFTAYLLGNKIIKGKYPSVKGSAKSRDNYILYLGIALDEKKRMTKKDYFGRTIKYPLVQWGITEKQALQYCYSKGFDWDGLYEDFIRVSCWCCPFSRMSELKTLYTKYPELWKQLKIMDEKTWRKFKSNYTLDELDERFRREESYYQLEL